MKQILAVCLVFLIGALYITACTGSVQPTESVKLTPNATRAPIIIPNTPTALPPSVMSPQGAIPPIPLYFLADQSIWLLEPGDAVVERLTPSDWKIKSFDVWSEDSRIAYGTFGGRLYVMMPGQEPRLLHDVSAETSYSTTVASVSWSPDGTRLGYTVQYTSERAFREAGNPSYPSGLWLLDMKNETPTWLSSNRYMSVGNNNVNVIRTLADPIWSPDGTALILTGHYWEWIDILWLDPIAPNSDGTTLRESPGDTWGWGSWASDSQSILLSGQQNTTHCDLVKVERASLESKRLINGESKGLWIADAQELSSGIVFLGSERDGRTQLYLGHQNEDRFEYAPIGPGRLCDSGNPGHVEWDSMGRWGVLVCESGSSTSHQDQVRIITLNGENANITPSLAPLTNAESLQMLWGK